MGIALIILGLFLWFVLAFNGSVGETFVNYSFFASALFMIVAGLLKIVIPNRIESRAVCGIALLFYVPMIWQRFNFKFDTDWVGFYFDLAFVIFMLIFMYRKPNSSIQPTGKSGG